MASASMYQRATLAIAVATALVAVLMGVLPVAKPESVSYTHLTLPTKA